MNNFFGLIVAASCGFMFLASQIRTDQSPTENVMTPVNDKTRSLTESMRIQPTSLPDVYNPLNEPAFKSSTNSFVKPAYDWLNKTLGRTDGQ